MLQAVSEMLSADHTEPQLEFQIRASCAKTILDKVIEGLDSKPNFAYAPIQVKQTYPVVNPDTSTTDEVPKPSKPPKEKIPDGKYKIVKDDNNRLVRIDGLPPEGRVELDGIIMTHADAKGKKFISGRIL